MNIDWSKAPKGATHWSAGDGDRYEAYWKPNRDGYDCYCPEWDNPAWQNISDELPDYAIPIPPKWNGEGLPPVGTVCEFLKHNSPPAPEGQWTVGDIRYVSDCTVIIGGDRCEHVHHPRNCSFRPLRTPEQIAAEERQKDLDSLTHDLYRDIGMEPRDAEILFNKGYRKQVQP